MYQSVLRCRCQPPHRSSCSAVVWIPIFLSLICAVRHIFHRPYIALFVCALQCDRIVMSFSSGPLTPFGRIRRRSRHRYHEPHASCEPLQYPTTRIRVFALKRLDSESLFGMTRVDPAIRVTDSVATPCPGRGRVRPLPFLLAPLCPL